MSTESDAAATKTVEARQYITNLVAEDIEVLIEHYVNPMLEEVGSGLQFDVKPRPVFDAVVTPGSVLVTDWHLTLKGTPA